MSVCTECGSAPFVLNRRVYTPKIIEYLPGRFKCSVHPNITWQDERCVNYTIDHKQGKTTPTA